MKLLSKTPLIHVHRSATSGSKTLVLIHGYGANEHDLFSLSPYIPEEWGILSFRAPLNLHWGGHAWYHIDMTNSGLRQDVESAIQSKKLIVEALVELQDTIEPEKLVLLGFSQGAILSWAIGLENAELIDGIAALSGFWIPQIQTRESNFDGLKTLNLYSSHGTSDEVIDISLARNSAEELQSNGVPIALQEYDQGHGIGPDNLRDLLQWLQDLS